MNLTSFDVNKIGTANVSGNTKMKDFDLRNIKTK